MNEIKGAYTIRTDEKGSIRISEEVIAEIAALAAIEVKGVDSLAGNLKTELKHYIGIKNLSQGVKVEYLEEFLKINVAIKASFGCNILDTCREVQEKVKNTVENMTGIGVSEVNVKIVDVNIDK